MIFLLFLTFFGVQAFGMPQGVRFELNDPRNTNEAQFRTFERRRPGSGSPSNIQDIFKIPIAVIQGTSAAAQTLSPQNSQAIQSVFNIPVTTLNAVGSYIKDTQNQGIVANDDDNQRIGSQRPLSLNEQRRQDRRERIEKLREEERERRRKMQEERFFLNGNSGLNFLSSLADILVGGNGHGGHFSGSHGHGHQWKPPKRPLKPIKPGHRPSHIGSAVNFPVGSYEVYEQVNERPVQSTGIFSWFQTGPNQFDDEKIENKIAPRSL